MIYDLYGAYNCPNNKVIYIFYELTNKVSFSTFIFFFIIIILKYKEK